MEEVPNEMAIIPNGFEGMAPPASWQALRAATDKLAAFRASFWDELQSVEECKATEARRMLVAYAAAAAER